MLRIVTLHVDHLQTLTLSNGERQATSGRMNSSLFPSFVGGPGVEHDSLLGGLLNTTEEQNESELMCREVNMSGVIHLLPAKLLIGMLYALIFVTAVTGNLLVLYVVGSNKHMQTVTNLFIANLAVSDLMVNFTSLWLTPLYTYMGRWVWGELLCHGLPLFQGTSIFISTLTLTSIAVDRYIVILHPLRSRISVQVCLSCISVIWLVSLLLVTPYALHMELRRFPQCDVNICRERWTVEQLKRIYGLVVPLLQFLVPFVLIGFCYVCIWWFLTHRATMVRKSKSDMLRKKRLLKMLVSMVVIFAICWLPFNTLNLIRDFGYVRLIRTHFSLYFLGAHLISMSATAWNPIVYAWMNDNFRREFTAALPCLFAALHFVRKRVDSARHPGQRPAHDAALADNALDKAAGDVIEDHSSSDTWRRISSARRSHSSKKKQRLFRHNYDEHNVGVDHNDQSVVIANGAHRQQALDVSGSTRRKFPSVIVTATDGGRSDCGGTTLISCLPPDDDRSSLVLDDSMVLESPSYDDYSLALLNAPRPSPEPEFVRTTSAPQRLTDGDGGDVSECLGSNGVKGGSTRRKLYPPLAGGQQRHHCKEWRAFEREEMLSLLADGQETHL